MTTAPIRSDWVGRVIDGRFTLHQWLGGSPWSGVFLTDLEGPGSQYAALKLIAADAGEAELYLANWTATRSLSHPHLMRLFHAGRCEIDAVPLLYVVTEFAGENLAEILPERSLTQAETREMLTPVLDALSFLHGKGLVHGRLKPSNILVVDDLVKISTDSVHGSCEATVRLPAAGTYDAPESGSAPISTAADMWSLGITIVEALTQHPPEWDRSKQSEPLVPSSIPKPFFDIARGCLRLDPARRFTVADVETRLNPVPAATVPVEVEKAAPPRSSKRLVGAFVVLAALILFAAIAAILMRSHAVRTQSQAAAMPLATEAPQAVPAHSKPSPQSPAPRTPAPPRIPTANSDTENGGVAERVLPDILPAAIKSIHGGFSLAIRVYVDPRGNVSRASFDSPGPSKYFGRVAMEAAQRWKFKPAQVDGQPVASVWLLQFQFTQSGTEITPTEVSP